MIIFTLFNMSKPTNLVFTLLVIIISFSSGDIFKDGVRDSTVDKPTTLYDNHHDHWIFLILLLINTLKIDRINLAVVV